MNRVKLMENCWELSPSRNSFKEYNAQILINRMFTMYTLGNNDEVKMLHHFQIMDVITDKQVGINFKQAMLDFINNLSDSDWHRVCKHVI